MDIGSSKITVMVGTRGVNRTICISGIGEKEYDGYENGEWYNPEGLVGAVTQAISRAQSEAHVKIRHLYVGVPGQFTVTQCREVTSSLGRRRRITEDDVDRLIESGDVFDDCEDFEPINCQPVYYTLGDERKLIQPVGLVSEKITGYISYILAEKKFTDLFDRILESAGIESHEYVSSILAESLFLFDDAVRDRYAVFFDVGYIVTDVVVARGDGIIRQFSFPLGGGHVTKDLCRELSIRFSVAEQLKRKVSLNLTFSDTDTYEARLKDRTVSFPAKQVNEIVSARLNKLARTIKSCLMSCDLPATTTYYLTGGGVCYMPGARDFISKKLDLKTEIATPRLPQYKKPHLSSALGLMDMVLGCETEAPQKKGFFARLFGR